MKLRWLIIEKSFDVEGSHGEIYKETLFYPPKLQYLAEAKYLEEEKWVDVPIITKVAT